MSFGDARKERERSENRGLLLPGLLAVLDDASVVFLITQEEKCSLELHLTQPLQEKNAEEVSDVRVERAEFGIYLIRIHA